MSRELMLEHAHLQVPDIAKARKTEIGEVARVRPLVADRRRP